MSDKETAHHQQDDDDFVEDTARRDPSTIDTPSKLKGSSSSDDSDSDLATIVSQQQRRRVTAAGFASPHSRGHSSSSNSSSALTHTNRLVGTPNPMNRNFAQKLTVYGDTRGVIDSLRQQQDSGKNNFTNQTLAILPNREDENSNASSGSNGSSNGSRGSGEHQQQYNILLDSHADDDDDDEDNANGLDDVSNAFAMIEAPENDDEETIAGSSAAAAGALLFSSITSPTGLLVVSSDVESGSGVDDDDDPHAHGSLGLSAEDYFPSAADGVEDDGDAMPNSSLLSPTSAASASSSSPLAMPQLPDMEELRAKGLLLPSPPSSCSPKLREDDDLTIYPHGEEDDREEGAWEDADYAATIGEDSRLVGGLALNAANLSRLQALGEEMPHHHHGDDAQADGDDANDDEDGLSFDIRLSEHDERLTMAHKYHSDTHEQHDALAPSQRLQQAKIEISTTAAAGLEGSGEGEVGDVSNTPPSPSSPMILIVESDQCAVKAEAAGGSNTAHASPLSTAVEREGASTSTPRQQHAGRSSSTPHSGSRSHNNQHHHQQQHRRPRIKWADTVTVGHKSAMAQRNLSRTVGGAVVGKTLPFVVPIKHALEQIWREEQQRNPMQHQHPHNSNLNQGADNAAAGMSNGNNHNGSTPNPHSQQSSALSFSAFASSSSSSSHAMMSNNYQSVSHEANADGTIHVRIQTIRPAPQFTDVSRFQRLAALMAAEEARVGKQTKKNSSDTSNRDGVSDSPSPSSSSVSSTAVRFRPATDAPTLLSLWPHLAAKQKQQQTMNSANLSSSADQQKAVKEGGAVPSVPSSSALTHNPPILSLMALLHPNRPPLIACDGVRERLHQYRATQHRVSFGVAGQAFDDRKLCSALPIIGGVGAVFVPSRLPCPTTRTQPSAVIASSGDATKETVSSTAESTECSDATKPSSPLLGAKRPREEGEEVGCGVRGNEKGSSTNQHAISMLSLGLIVS